MNQSPKWGDTGWPREYGVEDLQESGICSAVSNATEKSKITKKGTDPLPGV